MTGVETPSVVLSESRLSRRIEQKGAPKTGGRTFGFMVGSGPDATLRWRGNDVGAQSLMQFRPDEEIDCISHPDFHCFAVTVSDWKLREVAERKGASSVEEILPESDVLRLTDVGGSHLRRTARRLIDSPRSSAELLGNQFFLDSLEMDFVETLIDEVSAGCCGGGLEPVARVKSRALRKALEVISDRDGLPLTIAELDPIDTILPAQ